MGTPVPSASQSTTAPHLQAHASWFLSDGPVPPLPTCASVWLHLSLPKPWSLDSRLPEGSNRLLSGRFLFGLPYLSDAHYKEPGGQGPWEEKISRSRW